MLPSVSLGPGSLRIAVAGATGRVGSALISSLAHDSVSTLALSRTPEVVRVPAGVTVAAIDFDQPATLERALRNIDRLFIAHGTSPRQVRNEIALIDAAVAADVGHIVKLSALGPASQLHPLDWHMRIEAHLAQQNIGYTVLHPSAFLDILKRAALDVVKGTWGGAAGSGLANFIDTRDVADVARIALLASVESGAQRALHLTGPRAWNMQQIAQEMSRAVGREIKYSERTPSEQRAALLASGVSEFAADLLLGLDRLFRASALAETTSTVEQMTGHAPRTLTDWLAENSAIFRAAA